ncbi:MAG: co-chaperone GroES [Candidatus Paceibacterota bacterium]
MTQKTKVNFKPLADYVLIQPLEQEQKTPSGIVLPDSAKEKPQTGKVMAVGPGKISEHTGKIIPMSIKVGDTVMYKKWGGDEVKLGVEEWLLVQQDNIMALVK